MTKSSRIRALGQASDVWSLAAGDFDQDGDLDLAVAQNYSYDDNISVLLGRGTVVGARPLRHTLGGAYRRGRRRFDRDGDLDLVVGYRGVLHHPEYGNTQGGAAVMLGHGDGSFAQPVQVSRDESAIVHLADMDGDSRLDALATNVEAILLCAERSMRRSPPS